MSVLENKDSNIDLYLVFGNKTEEDILLWKELEEYAIQFNKHFKLTFIVDKALKPDDWEYPTGYVTKDLLLKSLPEPSDETLILTCGPPIMCQIVEKMLFEELGYNQEKHYFKF